MLYRGLHPLLDADVKTVSYPNETVETGLARHQRKHYPRGSTERVMRLWNRLNSHIAARDCFQSDSVTDHRTTRVTDDIWFGLAVPEQGIYETRENLHEFRKLPNVKAANVGDHTRAANRTRVHRPARDRYNWREEAIRFENRVYHVNIPPERRVRMFSIAFQDIVLPQYHTDIGNGDLEIRLCRTNDLSKHEHCRAMDSLHDDPGKALAIMISGYASNGEQFSFWSRTSGIRTIERMNTLADILIEQAPRREILGRPRRYKTRLPKLPGSHDL